MAVPVADESNDPVTLHRVIQSMIGEGLRSHYRPPKKLSHELFVLLLQLKEEERKGKSANKSPRKTRDAARALSAAG